MLAPQYHHVAPGQWINDPVGLHREGGRWILHDQRATGPGAPIGWGRATSDDLLHWRDEGLAITPEPDGWIYSGCVVPHAGRAHAFFTLHEPSTGLQSQVEARWHGAWHRLPGARVPPREDSRDPYVFRWQDEWRMLLAQPPPWNSPMLHPARLMLLRSADLETWREHDFLGPQGNPGELFETPILRRVPLAGAPEERWPWLLAVGVVDRRGGGAVSSTRAWFGRFDGNQFEPDGEPFKLDHGPDFYAPAVWSGTDAAEVVATGWCNNWSYARRLPSEGWTGGAHALPRRLTAMRGADGFALQQHPAALPPLGDSQALSEGEHVAGDQMMLTIEGAGVVRLGDLTLTLSSDGLSLDRACDVQELRETGFAGFWQAPRPKAPLTWLIDGCVAELFSADGIIWMTALTLRTAADPLRIDGGIIVTGRR